MALSGASCCMNQSASWFLDSGCGPAAAEPLAASGAGARPATRRRPSSTARTSSRALGPSSKAGRDSSTPLACSTATWSWAARIESRPYRVTGTRGSSSSGATPTSSASRESSQAATSAPPPAAWPSPLAA